MFIAFAVTQIYSSNMHTEENVLQVPTAQRNINNLRYAGDTTLMAEGERGTKESLDEGEIGEWKSWLKTELSKP